MITFAYDYICSKTYKIYGDSGNINEYRSFYAR